MNRTAIAPLSLLAAAPTQAQFNPQLTPDQQAAERRWAQRQAADAAWRQGQWYVFGTPCVPLPDRVIGARTPEEALAVIRQTDPDAYLVPNTPADWLRVIRTQGASLNMVRTPVHCRAMQSLVYGR